MTIVSMPELCTALSKSRVQLDRLIRFGMPVLTQGSKGVPYQFELEDCLSWYEDYESTREHQARIDELEVDASNEKDKDIKAAKLRKLEVEIERLELKLQRERGEVVPIAAVADVVSQQYGNLRSGLFALPNKLAPLLAGMTSVIEIDKTLTDYLSECLGELNGDAVVETSATEDIESN